MLRLIITLLLVSAFDGFRVRPKKRDARRAARTAVEPEQPVQSQLPEEFVPGLQVAHVNLSSEQTQRKPAWIAHAEAARVARKRSTEQNTKLVAGVPVFGEVESQSEQDWNVFVEPGTNDVQVQRLCTMNKNGCKLVGHPTGGVPFLAMRGTEADLENVIKGSEGAVKFAERDQQDFIIPGIEEDAGAVEATWGLNRIGADSRGKHGAGVTIYVQDTGVRTSHNDFGGRAISVLDVTSGSAIECNGALDCAEDRLGHGTHCAGTAAGQAYGVATAANIHSLKTLLDEGYGDRSWQFVAIDWVTTSGNRPAVLSMSLGVQTVAPGYATAIDAATIAGVVVVVAAGNSDWPACDFSPAYVPSAITVGSTTSTDARSCFSNYGSCTNIWAPGSDILSAGISSDSSTATYSGTSMACPHVSGAAALVLEADPSKNTSAVLQDLLDNAYTKVLTDLKAGDTNALLCVAEGGAPPSPPMVAPAPTPPPIGNCDCYCEAAYCTSYPEICGGCSFCSVPSPPPPLGCTPGCLPSHCTAYPDFCGGCSHC